MSGAIIQTYRRVIGQRRKAREIVILHERFQKREILAILLHGSDTFSETKHIACCEGLDQSVIEWIIQDARNQIFVFAHQACVPVADFAYCEQSSRLGEAGDIVVIHVQCSVNAESVNRIITNKLLDPISDHRGDGGISRVQIWQGNRFHGKPAILVHLRISPVRDGTERMIVLLIVKGKEPGIVNLQRRVIFHGTIDSLSHIIDHNINN
jgi:hypothetical protein